MSRRSRQSFRASSESKYESAESNAESTEQNPNPEPLASSTLFPFFERNVEERPTTPFQNLINALLLNTPTQPSLTMSNGTKELRINTPNNFTGNRDDLENFIQECSLYMTLNGAVYDTDEKRIIFMLSFMTEGTARAWKEAFVRDVIAQPGPTSNFGTLKQFIDNLKKAFEAPDAEGDARAKLRQLKQGKDSVDEYVAQFRILAGKAKMTDDKALTEYFMEGINMGILQKIFAQDKLPTKIAEWYEQASKHDSHYRRVQEILGRRRGTSGNAQTTNYQKKPFTPRYTQKDPNAMDVDRLSTNERKEYMAKGRCFGCDEIGHLVRDCPKKERKPNQNFGGYKKTAKTARAQIRNLIADMEPEEKEKLYEDFVGKGF